MALDYRKCAQEIADNIGGGANVVSAAHCATRLRLVIADNSKVNKEVLENVDGVKGMFESNGQLQLIIGTGTVNKVYDEFLSITGASAASKEDVKAAAAAQQPWYIRLLKPIGDVFVPILPAIVASGLMMGLVEALAKIPGLGFGGTDWFSFLDTAANTAFAYLPVIVAISAARVFGGNIFLGAVIGLLMIHSAFLNGWNVGSAEQVAKFFGLEINGVSPYLYDWAANPDKVTVASLGGIPQWHLFGPILPINRVGYQGHVIPVMLAVLFMSKVESWLHKHVPEMIDLFVTPLTTVLVTALVTLTIIGPIFSTLETLVLNGAEKLVANPIGSCIMGALYPCTVVMGLHHMYNVIEAGMLASKGLNTWMPIASAANFAQFGACLAVGLRSKNQKTKAVAIPSSMSAALGITEPAIFGVNMRFMKPFVGGMIGGAVGALVAAFMGIGASAYGVTGIPGYLTINNALLYTIVLAISGGLAFFITTVIFKEDEPKKAAPKAAPPIDINTQPVVMEVGADKVKSPAVGTLVPQEQIPDATFASGVLGAGLGITPSKGVIVAPVDGTISTVAESKHAIGISTDSGLELLIHVGVDTVAMNGDGFSPAVAEGDTVKAGDLLLNFDIDKIHKAGYADTVVFLLTNSDD
ncbi:MAG TPA: PTS beta-glucoside transporter subunit EIIBCA, partial [Lachnospiraceae bacterium]|nr:PTS beta-glucoside transporter subunit EIIBCA [Lachnospiraceae bacterium]